MLSFYVLLYDFNTKKPENHDIMPYLINTYNECKAKGVWYCCSDYTKEPITKKDFTVFVKRILMYRYWARCEYEWLMLQWPPGLMDTLEQCQNIINSSHKIDAWSQIEPNLDVVTAIFMANIKEI